MAYDRDNVFARILRGEIRSHSIHEDEHTLAFYDIQPQTPVHVLVIPKGEYLDFDDFAARASEAEIASWVRALGKVGRKLGVAEKGYRVLTNNGPDAHQEIPHLHAHLFAGADLGPMIRPRPHTDADDVD
jgi:diadenosine tetraphosphate (Ap4A) HIT family hydrolase